jgi:hypothetical protein
MSIARHLVCLQVRIETIAENHSAPGPTVSLEDTLSALTLKGRSYVAKLLERTRAFSDDPDEQAAAHHIRQLAERTWSHRRPMTRRVRARRSGRVTSVPGALGRI